MDRPTLRSERLRDAATLIVTWMVSAGYLVTRFDRRMIPHDEGMLAQSAERVLRGELPHRDFDDTYTGGLALLDALGFRVFGPSLWTQRLVVLLFMLFFVPCVYRIARRMAPPWASSLVTLLCVVWSTPCYFGGLPSWYNLFFASFGALALLRFSDTRRVRFLVLAGLCGGLSITFKSIGVYYVVACVLALVYFEQNRVEECAAERIEVGTRWLVRVLLCAIGVAFTALVAHGSSGAMDFIVFALPIVALVTALMANDMRLARARRGPSLAALIRTVGSYLLGLLAPLAAFVTLYAVHGGLGDLYHGVIVAPRARLQLAAYPLPPLSSLLASVPFGVVLAAPLWGRGPSRMGYLPLALITAFLVWHGATLPVYGLTWYSLRPLVPLVCVVAAVMLARDDLSALPRQRREALLVLCALCSTLNLVQFPYAFGVYFCFVAPLVVLAIAALALSQPRGGTRTHLIYAAYYLLFALCWVNTGHVRSIGVAYQPDDSVARLSVSRGGLLVNPQYARVYSELVTQVQAHSRAGSYIYATPDCPEVYFLSERKNPTRVIFEFLARDATSSAAQRNARVLAALEQRHVNLVVIHRDPDFSGPVDLSLEIALRARYPHETRIAPLFLVRWRDASEARPQSP